jgi:S1-C subfamily serine protease
MAQQTVLESLSSEFSELIQNASESVVVLPGRRSAGSGIVWQKNLVVTADHLLGRYSEFEVFTSTGDSVHGIVVGRDPSTDIAILKTQVELKPAEIATQVSLKAGQLAISVGRAAGGRLLSTLTMISGTEGAYRNWGGGIFDSFIRLDLPAYPGFSGSALLLPNGKIVGMNTALFSRHFGLTIPASNIDRMVQRLSAKGYVGKPYLGLKMQPVRIPEKLKQEPGIGLLIMGTEEGSPAEESGLQLGDVIVRLNGETINSMEAIQELLSESSIGKEVKVGILRGGNALDLSIKVGERPLRQQSK